MAVWTVGQFNQEQAEGNSYVEPVTDGEVIMVIKKDTGIIDDSSFSFANPCLELSSGLEYERNYYLHVTIKRLNSNQTFNIKLAYKDASKKNTQQLKQVEISQYTGGEDSKNIEVELIFHPNEQFDRIIFELVRTEQDLEKHGDTYGRTPLIAFMELDKIVNKNPLTGGRPLSKIGVQSRPDLMMCINGEEIHLPRSGIFELRDGVIKITFFSVVKAGTLTNSSRQAVLNGQLDKIQSETPISSINFSQDSKTRTIDAYTLDYMYTTDETEGG